MVLTGGGKGIGLCPHPEPGFPLEGVRGLGAIRVPGSGCKGASHPNSTLKPLHPYAPNLGSPYLENALKLAVTGI